MTRATLCVMFLFFLFVLSLSGCSGTPDENIKDYRKIEHLNVNDEELIATNTETHKRMIEGVFMSDYPYFHGAFLPNEIRNNDGEIVAELNLGIIGRIYLFVIGIIQILITIFVVVFTAILLLCELLIVSVVVFLPLILLVVGFFQTIISGAVGLLKKPDADNVKRVSPVVGVVLVVLSIVLAGIYVGLYCWTPGGVFVASTAIFDITLSIAELLVMTNFALGEIFAKFAYLPGLPIVIIVFLLFVLMGAAAK